MDTKRAVLTAISVLLLASCASGIHTAKKAPDLTPKASAVVEVKNTSEVKSSGDDGAFHIVGNGETIKHICSVYGLDLTKVAKINRILPPYTLREGDTVFLPSYALLPDSDVDSGKTEEVAANRDTPAIKKATRKTVANALLGMKDPLIPELKFPVPGGILTSPFGYRWGRLHKGLDIAAPVGNTVLACADGRVIFTGTRKKFRRYGNTVLIDHGKSVYTYYAHLDEILVKKNQPVKKGQKIALVGNTGRSTGPHLHLEVRSANTMYNPLAYFSPKEVEGTLMAGRFKEEPMGPVRAKWGIPDLLTAGR
jgi:murein DD-endopeptidase MepM/ murein hydrolase activator NlpD